MNAPDHHLPARPEWLSALAQPEWEVMLQLLKAAKAQELEILLGGGLALSAYTPLRRWTKDIDFYCRPRDRDRAVDLLNAAHFDDYYDTLPYDRSWIYRGIRDGVIVDIIWCFANHRAEVDDDWFHHSHRTPIDGGEICVIPAEELIWAKLYVFQRERCDWPDLLNLLQFVNPTLDWGRLRNRVGADLPLLEGLQSVFQWLCPDGECLAERVSLLDSREWLVLPTTP